MLRLLASLVLTSSFLLAASSSDSQKTPNLSGTWKGDIAKSTFPGPAPRELSAVIKDDGETLVIKQTEVQADGTSQTLEFKFNKHGKESVNSVGETELRTIMKPEGDALIERTEFFTPGGKLVRKSTLSLSADGKTLTLDGVITGASAEDRKMKIVLLKQ
jgi:hypothetical protein